MKKGSIIATTFKEPIREIKEFLKNELKKCYESINDIELIIVFSNYEKDKANKVMKSFRDDIEKNKLKVIINDKSGFAACLNKGILCSSSNYIFRIDTDDASVNNRYDEQIELLQKGSFYLCYSDICDRKTNSKIYYPEVNKIKLYILLGMNPLPHVSTCFDREFFIKNIGLYNESLEKSEDFDLWIRFLSITGTKYIIKSNKVFTAYNTKGSYEKSRASALSQIKIRLSSIKKNNLRFILIIGIIPNILRLFLPKFFIYIKQKYLRKIINLK